MNDFKFHDGIIAFRSTRRVTDLDERTKGMNWGSRSSVYVDALRYRFRSGAAVIKN